MEIKQIEAFNIIGITVRTTNKDGQAAKDIGALWQKFMSEDILDKIPHKIDNTIYSLYTEYDGDYTQPYTTLLGCKVSNLDTIPKGMVGKSFNESNYVKFISKGDLTKGAVYESWVKIWKTDLNRAYTVDFEVYGKKAQNPENAEVSIFVSILK